MKNSYGEKIYNLLLLKMVSLEKRKKKRLYLSNFTLATKMGFLEAVSDNGNEEEHQMQFIMIWDGVGCTVVQHFWCRGDRSWLQIDNYRHRDGEIWIEMQTGNIKQTSTTLILFLSGLSECMIWMEMVNIFLHRFKRNWELKKI